MKGIVCLSERGVQLAVDVAPEWMTVGYGHSGPGLPIQAAVAIGYDTKQLPLMRAVAHSVRLQNTVPAVAIFEDTVQVVFTVSPVTELLMPLVKHFTLLSAAEIVPNEIKLVSAADVRQTDDAFKIFSRCYETQKTISVVLMDTATVREDGGEGTPFDVFPVHELHTELQPVVA